MTIYVGKWSLLPEDWEGINGLYEKSEEEIRAESIREADAEQMANPDKTNLLGRYTVEEFEETFNANEGDFHGKDYWIKFFQDGKNLVGQC